MKKSLITALILYAIGAIICSGGIYRDIRKPENDRQISSDVAVVGAICSSLFWPVWVSIKWWEVKP